MIINFINLKFGRRRRKRRRRRRCRSKGKIENSFILHAYDK